MITLNPNGKKMILAIDGGGMRGMITIAMLAQLEKQTGIPCHQMFDMVAGTSTGAIIAAGICVGYSAQELLELVYRDRLPRAFPPDSLLTYIRYAFGGFRYLYALEPFVESLGSLVHGRKVGEFNKPILFLTTHDVRTSSTLYIVSKGPGAPFVADWPLSGAVGASGAAPIYFPAVAGNLVDGGVGMNGNPCLAVTVEALEYIGAAEGFVPGNIIVMSLGTGYTPNRVGEGKASTFNLINWIRYIIGEQLDESGLQQVFATRAIYGDKVDFRRYNPLLTRESVENKLGISTAGRPDPNELGLDSRSPQAIAMMEEIGTVYGSRIDWTAPNLMPWQTVGGHDKPYVDKAPIDWTRTIYK